MSTQEYLLARIVARSNYRVSAVKQTVMSLAESKARSGELRLWPVR